MVTEIDVGNATSRHARLPVLSFQTLLDRKVVLGEQDEIFGVDAHLTQVLLAGLFN
jgi:hypothetical protein